MTIVIFIIVLAVLILVHEFGHFILARKSGIRVDEFGLGFPPRIAGWKRGETLYSLNWLPFGGFVKIFGEDPTEEDIKTEDRDRSFYYQSKPVQALVIVGGVVFNWLLAVLLMWIAFATGVPASVESYPNAQVDNPRVIVTDTLENSPAELAGFKPGDQLVEIVARDNGETATLVPTDVSSVQQFIAAREGLILETEVLRRNESEPTIIEVSPELRELLAEEGVEEGAYIGIAIEEIGDIKLPIHKAFVAGFSSTVSLTRQTVAGLWGLLVGVFDGTATIDNVSGPVGIATFVGAASREGLASLLFLVSLISINLAIINLLPFPALDGGRLLFIIIEAIQRKPIRREFANMLNLAGFFILIALILFVTYHDIVKLF